MFIENPNKKTSYSFRVKPDLLESIKQYAKATNTTVPELLNEMIEDKVDGLHLTNDYLENNLATNSIIGLPPLTDIYNNGNYKEFGLLFENENRVFYEIKKIPNNLDIWTDTEGYTSNNRGTDHEGLSFVLTPELITKPEYLTTPELLFCCLIPVYFKISLRKQTVQVKNISFTNALEKIRNSPNIKLLDEFTQYTTNVKEIVYKYHNFYISHENTTPDYLNKVYINLINDLKELSKTINTNIVNHIDSSSQRHNQKTETNKLLTDNPYLLWEEIDKLRGQLETSNKEKEELKQGLLEMKDQIKKVQQLFTDLEDEEERVKVWNDLKK